MCKTHIVKKITITPFITINLITITTQTTQTIIKPNPYIDNIIKFNFGQILNQININDLESPYPSYTGNLWIVYFPKGYS